MKRVCAIALSGGADHRVRVLGAAAIPLTYFAVLIVANDRDYLGHRGQPAVGHLSSPPSFVDC
jgi:hypothetical protein